jgi:hypothetical protein
MISRGLKEVSCSGSSNEYPSPVLTLPRQLTFAYNTLKVILITHSSNFRLSKSYIFLRKKTETC